MGNYEVVRLLGINSPEVGEPFADEATQFFRSLTMGKEVYVELNPVELRDRHRRLLVHLWVEAEDGWVLVSEAIVRAGLARILVYYPAHEPYYCRLLHARALAQVDKLGLWGACPEPLTVGEIEVSPVRYVAEVVTVTFTVSGVGEDRGGLSLWAAESRYGFRAILDPSECPGFWEGASLPTADWVGTAVAVTGELLWDSFGGGPRIEVRFPDQLTLNAEEGGAP
ncbi:MAG: thermonuclease family protein [Chloroflexi bacterium]|nr:thermonuclease family protein [Chloroflexota bacterium]